MLKAGDVVFVVYNLKLGTFEFYPTTPETRSDVDDMLHEKYSYRNRDIKVYSPDICLEN